MKLTRRRFLKTSALGAVALPLWDPFSTAGRVQTLERGGASRRVVVIGAGLAGLCTAYQLSQAGHDVLVLEAQRRAGGRVQTLRDFSEELCGEAGATRIPNSHNFTLKYAQLFNLELDPFLPPGAAVYHLRGRRLVVGQDERPDWSLALTAEERRLGLPGAMEKAYGGLVAQIRVAGQAAADVPEALWKYDRMGWSQFLRERGLSEDAIRWRWASSGMWDDREAADRDSALRRLRNLALEPAVVTYYKIRGGNDRLPRAFALRLADKVRYGCPVVRIERNEGGGLRVIFNEGGERQALPADRVVVAVPLTLLRRMEIAPPFSEGKTRAIREIAYASSSKVFLQTRTRFWAKEGLNGFGYTDLNGYMQVWELGHSQPGPRGLLVAYLKMAGARDFDGLGEEQRLASTLEAVTKVHPDLPHHFEGAVSKSWDEDPWTRGAWARARPGDFKDLEPHVARPEGGVHFAGEHASPWAGGWMQGALESAERVAREINEAG